MATIKKTVKKAQNGSVNCPEGGNCNKGGGYGGSRISDKESKKNMKIGEKNLRLKNWDLFQPTEYQNKKRDLVIRSKKPTGEYIGTLTDEAKNGKKIKTKMKSGGMVKKVIKKTIKKK
jgi:hypothetical protein